MRLPTMRRATAVLAALLAAVVPARAEVVFGLPLPRTGPMSALGEQILRGATAAMRDVNAQGGIDGEILSLAVEDDACDPVQASAVARRFVADNVRLVVGHTCSAAAIAASEVYAEAGAVMVSPAATAARLTDRGLPGIFRVCGRDDDQGRLSAAVLAERFRDRRIAILHDNTASARALAEATKSNLNKIGVNEALYAAITPGEGDYGPTIARLKSAGIDVVDYAGRAPEMGLLVRQGAEQGYKPQWLGAAGLAGEAFPAIAGPAADGVLMTANTDLRRRPEAAAVVKGFQAEGVDPDGLTLYGYAAVQALTKAAQHAHTLDPRTLATTLKRERFDLLMGNVGFDQKGDVTAPGYVLYVWRNGRYEPA